MRFPAVCPHYPRLVRALFVAHMSIAHSRVHSQNRGCGDRAPRHRSAARPSRGLIARRHRLPVLKIAATVTRVGVERHVLLLDGYCPTIHRYPLGNAESNMIVMWVTRFAPLARLHARCARRCRALCDFYRLAEVIIEWHVSFAPQASCW